MTIDKTLAIADLWPCRCGALHRIDTTRNPCRIRCECGTVSEINTDWPPKGGRPFER